MQSTKDESGWGHRVGGGFARVHHSIYQKKRAQQYGIGDVDNVEDVSDSVLFASSTKHGYSPTVAEHFNNVGYNMQFLRHDAAMVSQRKWQNNIDYNNENGDMDRDRFLGQESVSSSPVSSFWYYKLYTL